ncbi:TPA: hypothetical protein ACIOJV_001330 [Streptococcus agalactiae]
MKLESIITLLIPFFTLIWTISWTITQDKQNKYKDFINKKDEKILAEVLLPYYENIELNLYKKITNKNKNEISSNLQKLINYLRYHNLFFYLGSSLTSTLIEIEEFFQDDQNNLEEFNKLYKNFSNEYFKLSWNVRKNLRIEKEQYFYISNIKLEVPFAREEYYLNPRIVLKYFTVYSLLLFLIFYIIFLITNSSPIIPPIFSIFLACFVPLYYFIIFVPNLRKLLLLIISKKIILRKKNKFQQNKK